MIFNIYIILIYKKIVKKVIKVVKIDRKIDKKIIPFGGSEIEKHKFHCHRNPILRDYVDIDKILIFSKISFGTKCHKFFLFTKIMKKLSHYGYCFQK